MTIAEILRSLNHTEHSALLSAMEEEITYYVEFTKGYFIGVNTDACPHLNCDQQAGRWRAGTINKEETINDSNYEDNST